MTTFIKLGLWISIIPLLFVSCKQGGAGLYTEKNGKTIYTGDLGPSVVVHMLGDPKSLHPTNESIAQKDEILTFVYERLFELDLDGGEMVPILAKSQPEVSEDKLSFTMELKENARWMDGSPVTAEDVLFNFKLLLAKEIKNDDFKSYGEFIESFVIDPENPLKFTLRMSQPYYLNSYIGALTMMINPRFYDPQGVWKSLSLEELKEGKSNEAIQRWATEFNDIKYGREVELLQGGSGPYKLVEWSVGQRIVLERRDDYWGKDEEGNPFRQYPDQIIFRVVKDEQATVAAFRQQSLDFSMKLTPNVFQQLLKDSLAQTHYKIQQQYRPTVVQMVLNNRPDGINQKPIFDDVRVRKALQLALPMEEILFKRLETDYLRVNSPVPPGNPHYNPDLPPFEQDTARAAALLAEAGWQDSDQDGILDKMINGTKTKLTFGLYFPPQSQTIVEMVDLFKEAWKKLGVEVELLPTALGTYVPNVMTAQFDAALLPLSPPASVPFEFNQNYHSSNWPGGGNFSGFSNAEADSLIDLIRVTTDEGERKKMAARLSEIFDEEVPGIFLYQLTRKLALHRRFSNGVFYKNAPYVVLNNLELVQ